MAILYDSTRTNATFTQSSGTAAELVDWIKDRLVASGWTLISGSSGSWVVQSQAAQGNVNAVYAILTTSGSIAQISLSPIRDTTETVYRTPNSFLLAAAAKTWRMIATPHQYVIFSPGSTASRDFSCGAVLADVFTGYYATDLPAQLKFRAFNGGNANSGTDTTARDSFRTRAFYANNSMGVLFDGISPPRFPTAGISLAGNWSNFAYGVLGFDTNGSLYVNNAGTVSEAYIAAYVYGGSVPAVLLGQMYDAIIVSGENIALETSFTFDGNTFLTIGSSPNYTTDGNMLPCVLAVRIP